MCHIHIRLLSDTAELKAPVYSSLSCFFFHVVSAVSWTPLAPVISWYVDRSIVPNTGRRREYMATAYIHHRGIRCLWYTLALPVTLGLHGHSCASQICLNGAFTYWGWWCPHHSLITLIIHMRWDAIPCVSKVPVMPASATSGCKIAMPLFSLQQQQRECHWLKIFKDHESNLPFFHFQTVYFVPNPTKKDSMCVTEIYPLLINPLLFRQ